MQSAMEAKMRQLKESDVGDEKRGSGKKRNEKLEDYKSDEDDSNTVEDSGNGLKVNQIRISQIKPNH